MPGKQTYNWKAQSNIGTNYEILLDKHFSERYVVRAASLAEQRMGIDRFFSQKITSCIGIRSEVRRVCFSVEYKADVKADKTGNIFVEIDQIRSDGGKKKGWALTFYAQVLVIFLPRHRTLLLANAWTVKTLLNHWIENYSLSTWVKNEVGNSARGVLVPIEVFTVNCCFGRETIRAGIE